MPIPAPNQFEIQYWTPRRGGEWLPVANPQRRALENAIRTVEETLRDDYTGAIIRVIRIADGTVEKQWDFR